MLKGFYLFSSKKSQSSGAGETESYSPSLLGERNHFTEEVGQLRDTREESML